MPNSHGEELLMGIDANPEISQEIREVDPLTRRLEVLCYIRDKLLESEPGELCEDQEGFRDATVELSNKKKLDLGHPPERIVSIPEDLVKQVKEQERRERLADHIVLAYYAGVVGVVRVLVKDPETNEDVEVDKDAYQEAILPLVKRLGHQDAAVIMSSHKDGDNVRIKNTPREEIPNSLPVADWFDSRLAPLDPSSRSY